jgi:hypothetical protein
MTSSSSIFGFTFWSRFLTPDIYGAQLLFLEIPYVRCWESLELQTWFQALEARFCERVCIEEIFNYTIVSFAIGACLNGFRYRKDLDR